jgi:hypothetical protein
MAPRANVSDSMEGEPAIPQDDLTDLEAAVVPESQDEPTGSEHVVERTDSAGQAYSIFSHRAKTIIVITASISTFFSPLTASIYFPALNTIADDLNVSDTLVNLTVTAYMVCILFISFN